MSEKFTNKQQVRIKELERLAWNAALVEARKAVIESKYYYKENLHAIDCLWKVTSK